MLADRGIPRSLAGWCVEPKLDGWRVRVLVDAPGVRVMTPGGVDITERVAELRRCARTRSRWCSTASSSPRPAGPRTSAPSRHGCGSGAAAGVSNWPSVPDG